MGIATGFSGASVLCSLIGASVAADLPIPEPAEISADGGGYACIVLALICSIFGTVLSGLTGWLPDDFCLQLFNMLSGKFSTAQTSSQPQTVEGPLPTLKPSTEKALANAPGESKAIPPSHPNEK